MNFSDARTWWERFVDWWKRQQRRQALGLV